MNRISKLLSLVLLVIMISTFMGCSTSTKAKMIYNDNSLSNRKKIDRLETLSAQESQSVNSYNKTVSDRAWKAIESGDYSKASNIMQGAKYSDSKGTISYYVSLLQEKFPKPDTIKLNISKYGYGKYVSYNWKVEIDYPEVSCKSSLGPAFKYMVKVNDRYSNSWDTGEFNNYEWGASFKTLEDPYEDYKFKLVFYAYPGHAFEYYKESSLYEYELVVRKDMLDDASYEFSLVNEIE